MIFDEFPERFHVGITHDFSLGFVNVCEHLFDIINTFKSLNFRFEGVSIGDGEEFWEELLCMSEFFFLLIDEYLGWFGHKEFYFSSFNRSNEFFFDEFFQYVVGVNTWDFRFLSNGTGITAPEFQGREKNSGFVLGESECF